MADGGLQHGVKLSQTSPAFLHANSTSHTWPFSALAEIVDNAYDPDVAARVLQIDVEDRMGKTCLLFTDDGNGMSPDKLHKMLSFGYCEKVEVAGHKPVGHYGNGFKSGSMRLAKDAIVFTKSLQTMSVGFLSQSYLKAINATTVLVPMVTWNIETMNVISENSTKGSIEAITQHSLFRTEKELLAELEELNLHKTGTRILLYNLKRGTDDKLELDLESNSKDIINSERQELDFSTALRPVMEHVPEYIRSFREYCSILFLKPRMKIMLRGYKVKTKLISKSLSQTEKDVYKPVYLPKPIKIIFGFSSSKEDFGMMMYHRNRLIKAYEHVGYQKQANELGTGVVGVVEVDFLEPVHNKQDFNKTDRYNACTSALGSKLNDYWNTKMSNNTCTANQDERLKADWTWVQCDNCLKWRRLPDGYTDEGLPEKWFCYMNNDPTHNRCDVDEEPEDEDELQRASYNKVKKKTEPRVTNDMMIRERRIAEKERTLITMQQTLQSMEPLAPSGSGGNRPTIADLEAAQQELVQAREREQQQRDLIARLQHQGDKIVQGQNAMRNNFMARNSNMSTLNNIGKTGVVNNHGSQSSQRQGNSLVKQKRKMMAKEKIQLPGGDAVIVTRNDSTSGGSDSDEDVTPIKRHKRPGLVVKVNRPAKPKINGETIVIDSDEEETTATTPPSQRVSPDVKPDVSALDKSIKKEKPKTPEKRARCPTNKSAIDKIFMSRMVQTDPVGTPDANNTKNSTSTSNVKDSKENLELVQEKLSEVKSQLSSLRNNVGKLLQTILPDLVVDDVAYIDAIVREMVRVNKTEPVKNGSKTSKMDTNDTGSAVEVPEQSH